MRRNRFQKLLYLAMACLGIYILYMTGVLLKGEPESTETMLYQNTSLGAKRTAAEILAEGYFAFFPDKKDIFRLNHLLKQLVPVYVYLTEEAAEEEEKQEESRDTEEEEQEVREASAAVRAKPVSESLPDPLLSQVSTYDALIKGFYTVDEDTCAPPTLLDAQTLLSCDLRIDRSGQGPQILIYHTHSQEMFADSDTSDVHTSIVGMGEYLAQLLRDSYGYGVIHDTEVYDLRNGVLDRSKAYDYARASVQKILAEHPGIQVVIDLHRDGVDGKKLVTEIDGKPVSRIMFFNGISRNSAGDLIPGLPNPYVIENLAFSLQLQLLAAVRYPGFTRNIYLKAQRYNLHLRPRSLLIEAGTQLNTVEEERNAMEPLADLLHQVLG